MDDVLLDHSPSRERCERWARLCGRKSFGVHNVNNDTYMCSKHFVGCNGPTIDHPDLLPASATDYEVWLLSSNRKRKSQANRSTLEISLSKSWKKLIVDNETESSEIWTLLTIVLLNVSYH